MCFFPVITLITLKSTLNVYSAIFYINILWLRYGNFPPFPTKTGFCRQQVEEIFQLFPRLCVPGPALWACEAPVAAAAPLLQPLETKTQQKRHKNPDSCHTKAGGKRSISENS